MEDPEQKLTYAAEDMVTTWLDAVPPETGEVQVVLRDGPHGRTVSYAPETEPRFSRPSEVTVFVDEVLTRLRQQAGGFGSNYRGREQRDVHVVSHRGWKKATYRNGFIHLPERERGGGWALRGMVVLHELAHHLNTGTDGAIIDAHGEGFRSTFVQLLTDIGWVQIATMLRDAHQQSGLDRRNPVDDGMLAKVGKLLRHAEGASTEAERDTFFTKAQELATLHSIELAVARAAHASGEAEQTPTFEAVRLGHRGKPSNVRFVNLMLAIARANDLRCTIRTDNTVVTLYGFPLDIQVAKTLYVTLVLQMIADGDSYIRSGAHRPVHGRTARVAFYEGWTTRIGLRLREAQRSARVAPEAAETAPEAGGTEQSARALALVAKEVEVNDYFDNATRAHGVSGTWRGTGQVQDLHSEARGWAAAERARLDREQELAAG